MVPNHIQKQVTIQTIKSCLVWYFELIEAKKNKEDPQDLKIETSKEQVKNTKWKKWKYGFKIQDYLISKMDDLSHMWKLFLQNLQIFIYSN